MRNLLYKIKDFFGFIDLRRVVGVLKYVGVVLLCLVYLGSLSFGSVVAYKSYAGEYDGEPGIQGEQGLPGVDGEDGENGSDGLTPYIGENGNWWIGEVDTGVLARGVDGEDGVDGQNGVDGQDGLTPYVGENGNWWIGEVDTGVLARGVDGENGSDGQNGVDGQDGENGSDGLTPYIGENGNWWIGEVDTGVLARGVDGENGSDGQNGVDGQDGEDGQDGLTPYVGENGNWWIGDMDTYVFAGNAGYSFSMVHYSGNVGYIGSFDLPIADFDVGDGALSFGVVVLSADCFFGEVINISGDMVTVFFVYHLDLEGSTKYHLTEGENYDISLASDYASVTFSDVLAVLPVEFFIDREMYASVSVVLNFEDYFGYSVGFSFNFIPVDYGFLLEDLEYFLIFNSGFSDCGYINSSLGVVFFDCDFSFTYEDYVAGYVQGYMDFNFSCYSLSMGKFVPFTVTGFSIDIWRL
jgi:hypothetical protein